MKYKNYDGCICLFGYIKVYYIVRHEIRCWILMLLSGWIKLAVVSFFCLLRMYIRMVYGRVATHVVENCYVGEVHRMVFMSYGMTLVLLDIFAWFIFSGVHLRNMHCTNFMLSQFHVFHCTIFYCFICILFMVFFWYAFSVTGCLVRWDMLSCCVLWMWGWMVDGLVATEWVFVCPSSVVVF